jgi:hypothetical protein
MRNCATTYVSVKSALIATLVGFCLLPSCLAQGTPTEIPKGSALRAELFDIARPEAESKAGQKVKFHGSLKRLGDWAYFGGFLVDTKGRQIQVDELSPYCLVLWHREGGAWRVLDFGAGVNEPYHLEEWPRKFGAPLELISE